MTLRKRYILIIIGVIIFFTATPLLIMGIQGYIYDFDQKKFVKTAILVIKTDPKGAEITLTGPSGSKHFKTNKTIRFLTITTFHYIFLKLKAIWILFYIILYQ